MSDSTVERVLHGMKKPMPGLNYYFLLVTAKPDGEIVHEAFTHWVGFTEHSPRREIREGSIVRPEYFMQTWERLSIPCLVASTGEQLLAYKFVGGPALIEESLAEEFFADVVLECEMVPDTVHGGFKSIRGLPSTSFWRAPRPKLRMNVLRRDQFKCRICGRKPDDHADVELHVHHVRPWKDGGLTEEQNLITLCHTCHNGLEPHDELVHVPRRLIKGKYVAEILSGMKRYQKLVKGAYETSTTTETTSKRRPRKADSNQ